MTLVSVIPTSIMTSKIVDLKELEPKILPPVVSLIKLFFLAINALTKQPKIHVHDVHFHPILKFVGKAGAFTIAHTTKIMILALPTNLKLG